MDDEARTHFFFSQQQVPAKHATERQHSSTRDGPNTLKKYRMLSRDPLESVEKKKFRLQVSSVYLCLAGYGDERVQQVHSELRKHTDKCRKTNTHVFIGGDFNAQV